MSDYQNIINTLLNEIKKTEREYDELCKSFDMRSGLNHRDYVNLAKLLVPAIEKLNDLRISAEEAKNKQSFVAPSYPSNICYEGMDQRDIMYRYNN